MTTAQLNALMMQNHEVVRLENNVNAWKLRQSFYGEDWTSAIEHGEKQLAAARREAHRLEVAALPPMECKGWDRAAMRKVENRNREAVEIEPILARMNQH